MPVSFMNVLGVTVGPNLVFLAAICLLSGCEPASHQALSTTAGQHLPSQTDLPTVSVPHPPSLLPTTAALADADQLAPKEQSLNTASPPLSSPWQQAQSQVRLLQAQYQARQRARRQSIPLVSKEVQPADSAEAGSPPLVVPYSLLHPTQPADLPAVLAGQPWPAEISPEIISALDQAAENFLREVAGEPAGAEDPVYQERWRAAQLRSDELVRLRYGDHVWHQLHLAAHRQAMAPQEPAGTGELGR
jgi:hypothetical protein